MFGNMNNVRDMRRNRWISEGQMRKCGENWMVGVESPVGGDVWEKRWYSVVTNDGGGGGTERSGQGVLVGSTARCNGVRGENIWRREEPRRIKIHGAHWWR